MQLRVTQEVFSYNDIPPLELPLQATVVQPNTVKVDKAYLHEHLHLLTITCLFVFIRCFPTELFQKKSCTKQTTERKFV